MQAPCCCGMLTGSMEQLFVALGEALASIREPRYFESERGYQGALIAQLEHRLGGLGLPDSPIVEQEYQKTLPRHGTTIRPDLIVHVPFERGRATTRQEGNFVAIELKLDATTNKADEDFESLRLMAKYLRYPATVFMNIGARRTYADRCPPEIASHTACFAVHLEGGEPIVLMERP